MAIAFVKDVALVSTANATTAVVTIATAANNTLVATIEIVPNTNVITGITDSAGNVWTFQQAENNGGNVWREEVWTSLKAAAVTSVTVHYTTFIDVGDSIIFISEYSGVQAIGTSTVATGTASTQTISITTQDANNFVVCGSALNSALTYTAVTGTIRDQQVEGASSSSVLIDNTAASASSVTCAVSTGSGNNWSMVAVELRSTAGGPTVFEDDSYSLISGAPDSNITVF